MNKLRVRNFGMLLAVGLVSGPLALSLAETEPAPLMWIAADDDDSDGDVSFFGWTGANRGFLGVRVGDGEDTEGASIVEVIDDTPAEKAGLRSGDVIVSLGGQEIDGGDRLTEALGEYEPEDEVEVVVIRDGKRRSFSVELGERPGRYAVFGGQPRVLHWDDEQFQEQMREVQKQLGGLRWSQSGNALFFGRPKLGVELVEVTPELREHLGGDGETGVLVGKVLSGMPAEDGGIEVGDLIVGVDDASISSANELVRALADTDGTTIDVELIRDGRRRNLSITIPETAPDEDRPRGPRAELFLVEPDVQRAIRQATAASAAAARSVNREAVREAVREATVTRREAMAAARDAMEESRHERQEAMAAAREAMSAALRVQREHQVEINEAIRKAMEQLRKSGRVF